jgi:hypothetical protein
VTADRRRSQLLAVGVTATAAVLLLASTSFPRSDAAGHQVTRSAAPMTAGVVGVEVLDPSPIMTTGLVIDAQGHVAVPLDRLRDDIGLRVHCGAALYDAALVAADPAANLAVVEVESPYEVAPLPAVAVAEGDELTLTSVADDGERRATQVRVTEVSDEGHPAAFLAEGAVQANGVLSTLDGRLAGWVVSGHPSDHGGEVVALSARPLLEQATQLLAEDERAEADRGADQDDARTLAGGTSAPS